MSAARPRRRGWCGAGTCLSKGRTGQQDGDGGSGAPGVAAAPSAPRPAAAVWVFDGILEGLSPSAAGLTVPIGEELLSWSAGSSHCAGITADGLLHCAGDNYYGQLGHGSGKRFGGLPVEVSAGDLPRFAAVSCGTDFSAALSAEGGVFTWGCPYAGRLGRHTGVAFPEGFPKKVSGLPSGDPVALVAAGSAGVIALTAADRAFGWGCGVGRLCGQESADFPVAIPALSERGIRRLCCGDHFGVAETSGPELLFWGRAVKYSGPHESLGPVCDDDAELGYPFRDLAAGGEHAAIADAGGRVFVCTGRSHCDSLKQIRLPEGERAVHVGAATNRFEDAVTVALTESGQLWECRSSGCAPLCRPIIASLGSCPTQGLIPVGGASARSVALAPVRRPSGGGVLRFADRVFGILSDAGIAAEAAVELLKGGSTGNTPPAADGPLVVYVRAPDYGHPDPLCLEVGTDTTVGGLAALAALRLRP
eukprot:TRINITY_DN6279_c0_g1_i2.p1 TRINITY_DN6279_c0_g1~~TRINITY_DN6279_c0_g1_i2.p1  ORF type:complete len:503 (+),score=80.84 TRINITY_DN6279_c0_g1_i2:77-1510(+)